jgi:hypothetical protein
LLDVLVMADILNIVKSGTNICNRKHQKWCQSICLRRCQKYKTKKCSHIFQCHANFLAACLKLPDNESFLLDV